MSENTFKPGASRALFFSTTAGFVLLATLMRPVGGFFPPLELGLVKDATGSYTIGFVLLAVFALLCLAVNYFTFLRDGGKTAEA